jgi:nucleoside-diphosphate-sugar epimerase
VKTVVTGGAGFIGSFLCDALISEGHQVVCIDNLITGRKENIEHLLDNDSFTFIKRNVAEPIDKLESNLDFIFHLASPASPVDYQEKPLETMKANSDGTEQMLKLARKNDARFLLASTSEVYGDPEVNPQMETYWGNVNPNGPRSCYDESKRYAEALTMVYAREFGVKVRIVRIFNTYGPRMRKDDGRVISNFINQALEGKPITIYGDGTQTRSFCYVSDMVAGLQKLMFTEGLDGEVVNIGNPEEIQMKTLAEKIKKITQSDSKMVNKPLPQDDPQRRCPDISKAKRLLNWQPEISLTTGLKQTIAHFKKEV